MGRKKKQCVDAPAGAAAAAPVDPRRRLVGRHCAVPVSFFSVDVPNQFYLGKVAELHATKKDAVWLTYDGWEDYEHWVPAAKAEEWLITEARADRGGWYEEPPDSESEDEEEDAPEPRALQPGDAGHEPRGRVRGGRWRPAEPAKKDHLCDHLTWKESRGDNTALAQKVPAVCPRKLPVGVQEGFQQSLPRNRTLIEPRGSR